LDEESPTFVTQQLAKVKEILAKAAVGASSLAVNIAGRVGTVAADVAEKTSNKLGSASATAANTAGSYANRAIYAISKDIAKKFAPPEEDEEKVPMPVPPKIEEKPCEDEKMDPEMNSIYQNHVMPSNGNVRRSSTELVMAGTTVALAVGIMGFKK